MTPAGLLVASVAVLVMVASAQSRPSSGVSDPILEGRLLRSQFAAGLCDMRRVIEREAALLPAHELEVRVPLGAFPPRPARPRHMPVRVRLMDDRRGVSDVDDRQTQAPRPPDHPVVPARSPDG